MSLREALYTAMVHAPGVAAIVGSRVYPDRLPDGVTMPAVSFLAHVSEDDSEYRTHDPGPVERAVATCQLNAYASTGDEASRLAATLVLLFSGLKEGIIGETQVMNRVDTFEPAINRHRCIIDLAVDYQRTGG